MVMEEPQPGQGNTVPETTRRLLTVANYFLQRRNFTDCCKYAARARDSDPFHSEPTRILSIASVLTASRISCTHHDYYAVLNLPRFDSDAARIGSGFETLASILDPNVNPCPLASEAFGLVVKAWSVLSNPVEKAKFDSELMEKMAGGGASGSGGGTFWTVCPYCYYVYEYDRVLEDCSLRCANERCRRVFHAVAMRAPPPPDLAEKGQYWCPGFMPLAMSNSNGEGKGEELWNPFVSADEGRTSVVANGDSVVISDDETVKGKESHNQGSEGYAGKSRDKSDAANGEKLVFANGNSMEDVRMKRKKSVPWNSKKVMGRGIRVSTNEIRSMYGAGEGNLLDPRLGGETHNGVESEVEFFEGDDDVLVSLSGDFDMGNGETEP